MVLVLVIKGGGNFSYISDRLESWRNPLSDPSDKTHQTYESLLAIGSGGWFGLGFGESRQKYLYLPESQNDFIFSIICEELGFIGGVIVVLLFVLFVIKGFQIAANARDRFGMLLATGITIQIGSQALLNIMVASNAFPNTGISLPFFSAGGTALVFQLFEDGHTAQHLAPKSEIQVGRKARGKGCFCGYVQNCRIWSVCINFT